MSDLPAPVVEAGLLFQRASILGDREALQRIIDWGHEQIDVAYPEDPIRVPLNLIRRARAHREWDKVVRTAGKDLRGTIMSSIVRDLEFEITRRQDEIRADDQERRRRQAVLFDADVRLKEQKHFSEHQSELRIKEHERISQINHRIAQEQIRLEHDLRQQGEDAASRRRKDERDQELEHQITLIFADAIKNQLGENPTQAMIDAASAVGHKLAEIRSNPAFTEDDKHLQIQILLQSLPRVIGGLRPRDV